jgi:hypothetical protein
MIEAIALDAESRLVTVMGDVRLALLVTALAGRGFRLPANVPEADAHFSVHAWLGRGAPGAWTRDPVDHLVAGFEARIGRTTLSVCPSPRRSTGPDLFALVTGHEGKLVLLTKVTLRVEPTGMPDGAAVSHRQPDPTPAESRMWAEIEKQLAAIR